jgi:hypothetical protein
MMIFRKALFGSLLLSGVACSSSTAPPPDWSLVKTPKEDTADAELKRVHEMQKIHVYNPTGGDDGKGEYTDWEAGELVSRIENMCHTRHYCQLGVGDLSCQDSMVLTACDLAADTCTLEMLYGIADLGVVPATVEGYVLPPQSEPARMAILDATRLYGQKLAYHAANYLHGDMYADGNFYTQIRLPGIGNNDCGPWDLFDAFGTTVSSYLIDHHWVNDAGEDALETRSIATVAINALTTGERIVRNATFDEVKKMVAVAEWDRGSTSSAQLAEQRVFSRPELSRAAAAHLLVGGPEGLRISTDADSSGELPTSRAFCTGVSLTSGARKALLLLRNLGLSPSRITGSDDIQTVIDGDLEDGSALQRYNAFNKTNAQSLFTQVGLSANDFSEARQYLANEIFAFSRSQTAKLADLSGGSAYQKYAGSSASAPERGDEYYTAITRAGGFDTYAGEDDPNFPRDLAFFYSHLLWTISLKPLTSNGTLEESMRPLYLWLQRMREQSKGNVSAYFPSDYWGDGKGAEVWVNNADPNYFAEEGVPGLRMITGEDALDCYLHHSIEGAPCTDSPYLLLEPYYDVQGDYRSKYVNAVVGWRFTYDMIVAAHADKQRNYIVGELAGRRVVVGSLPALGQDKEFAYNFTVLPEVEHKAAEILRPSRDWCTRAAISCNGDLFDERLPLENELNRSGDNVEDSWRYYLDRASAAASQADELGQKYLNSQLAVQSAQAQQDRGEAEIRQRVEAHLDELQTICGVSADTDELLNLFGQEGKLENTVVGECEHDTDCTSSDGALRQCIGSRCVTVPSLVVSNQDSGTIAARLSECIGQDALVPYTLYGDRDVCVREGKDLCGDDTHCPYVVPSGYTTAAYCGQLNWVDSSNMGRGYVPITSKLNYTTVADRAEYSKLRRRDPRGGSIYTCRQSVKSQIIDKGWFKLTPYSAWLDAEDADSQPCREKQWVVNPSAHPNAGYDPALVIAERDPYIFPLWVPSPQTIANGNAIIDGGTAGLQTASRGAGVGLEIIKCPETVNPADVAGLSPDLQLYLLKEAVSCSKRRLDYSVGTQVLIDLPSAAKAVLMEHGPTGPFPKLGGEYGQGIADLRAALVAQKEDFRLATEELVQMESDLETYRAEMQDNGLQIKNEDLAQDKDDVERTINDIKMKQIELEEDSALFGKICTIALAVGAGAVTGGAGAVAVAAASAAGNAMLDGLNPGNGKLDLERRIIDAQNRILELDKQQHDVSKARLALDAAQKLLKTRESLRRHSSTIVGYFTDAYKQIELVRGKLVALEELRQKGRRSLSEAVAAASPQLRESDAKVFHATSALADLDAQRYKQAFKGATRLAFLAKRAIETRLGVRFSEMDQTLPLLDAPPSAWENDVCVATGLDYNRIIGERGPSATLNGFVGAYVDKLRNVVDGYQLQYAFREGTDQLTVSMKDDVANVVATCHAKQKNLLLETLGVGRGRQVDVDLGNGTVWYEPQSTAWVTTGCDVGDPCVTLNSPGTSLHGGGDLDRSTSIDVSTSVEGAGLAQSIALKPGRYVLSWLQRTPDAAVVLRDSTGEVVPSTDATWVGSHQYNGWIWRRYIVTYDLATEGTYQVLLGAPTRPSPSSNFEASIGAVMLEAVAADSSATASEFVGTEGDLDRPYPCADTDGKIFRNTAWTRNCERKCPQGTSSNCPNEQVQERCYWEAPFSVSVQDIELGRSFKNSGFARDNFNYRIDSLGVNVVGSGVRDCSQSLATGCAGNAFVAYSLDQFPPFIVRDHSGHDVSINLFNGSIESAKALSAERFLTNPLSSADTSLMEPYMRSEFSGRPLDGNYTLRIWEDPTFRFESVQDVQLLIKYRYWTATH